MIANMNTNKIAKLLELGAIADQDKVEALKKALVENDYKVSIRGALLFLDNCDDLLSQEEKFYWGIVALQLEKEAQETYQPGQDITLPEIRQAGKKALRVLNS